MVTSMRSLFALPGIVSSVIVTVLLLNVQRFGVFQTFELRVFDQMMQMRADSESDSRLLIVAVTEEDIRRWGHPLSGEVLDNLLAKLTEYEPRAIGLDIFRDIPVEPGHNKLLERLKLDDLIVPICEHSESGKPAIPPPTGIEAERVGFSDIVQDPDGTIRRNLLLIEPAANDACKAEFSFSLQLALKYLAVGGIQPQFNSNGELQLRDIVFKPIEANFGAYQNIDAGGDQILLNYRSSQQVAQQVTVTDVLTNKISQDLVKDRIVLIGSTAPSLKDIQKTPYSSGKSDNSGDMTGVAIHASSISQILSTVLNGESLFWSFPESGEAGWILLWSLAGGIIALRLRHPLLLGIAGAGALTILFGSNFFIFTQAGWVPVITPALGFVLAGGSVIAYSGYQSKLSQEIIEQNLKDREEAIAQLQAMLRARKSELEETEIFYPIGQELPLNTLVDNRYKITKSLSFGGFGRTYLAEDTKRPGNPICVVKQFKPPHNVQDENSLNLLKRAFETEAKVLEDLGKQHNRIPQLLAYFEDTQQFYLVQEYIKGQPLDKEIFPGQKLEEFQVVQILKEILQILVFVHGRHIIHGDIKPSNLIRRESDEKIVLIDFGAVKVIQSLQTENPAFEQQKNQELRFISRGYAPPEQFEGQLKYSSDIYALGIVAIQALSGADPTSLRPGQNNAIEIVQTHNHESRKYWREQVQVSDNLALVLEKMVDIDFTKRYQSAEEVLDTLKSL
ncbi:MAG: CHASE2 domain-containing serine/threonine-protein kinase [Nostocales cyanobacterium 94392]|nr:CHASE2 domain-containing serine/threonine-protein kinase [Nostocales cyanobacterium 94392]